MLSLIKEMRRRNMFRVAGVYLVTCWLLTQVSQALEGAIGLPEWFDGMVVALMIIAFPVTMVMAWAFELTPEGIRPTQSITPDDSIAPKTGRMLDYAILLLLLVVAAMMGLRGMQTATGEGGLIAPLAARPAPALQAPSIAVLPFADLSPQGDQEYFADGVSEELLNVLAQVRDMKVAGRTSSFAFKGRQEDLREIGRVLNVAHIVEGSVRKSGNTVRITAQLIEADSGFHLWSETYDREMTNIFEVQDEIAASILRALRQHFEGQLGGSVPASERGELSAYSIYLQAKPLIASRVAEQLEEADRLLREAEAIDGDYAPVLTSRAMLEMLLSDAPGAYGDKPVAEALEQAQQLITRALAINPDLPDAHAVQGLVHLDRGDIEAAIVSLRQAIRLNPSHLDARNWLSFALGGTGRYRDVAEAQWELFQIDPLYRPAASNAIQFLDLVGDRERARQIVARVEEIDPGSVQARWARAVYLERGGRFAEALTLGSKVQEEAPDANRADTLITICLALANPECARRFPLASSEPFVLLEEGDDSAALVKARALLDQAPDYFEVQISYINVLAHAGRWQDLMAYFDATYENVAAFEEQLTDVFSANFAPFASLSQAALRTGRSDVAEEALRRWRMAIDMARAGGVRGTYIDRQEALWHASSGNVEESLNWIEQMMANNDALGLNALSLFQQLDVAGDPRFAALWNEETARINLERVKLGWDALPVGEG